MSDDRGQRLAVAAFRGVALALTTAVPELRPLRLLAACGERLADGTLPLVDELVFAGPPVAAEELPRVGRGAGPTSGPGDQRPATLAASAARFTEPTASSELGTLDAAPVAKARSQPSPRSDRSLQPSAPVAQLTRQVVGRASKKKNSGSASSTAATVSREVRTTVSTPITPGTALGALAAAWDSLGSQSSEILSAEQNTAAGRGPAASAAAAGPRSEQPVASAPRPAGFVPPRGGAGRQVLPPIATSSEVGAAAEVWGRLDRLASVLLDRPATSPSSGAAVRRVSPAATAPSSSPASRLTPVWPAAASTASTAPAAPAAPTSTTAVARSERLPEEEAAEQAEEQAGAAAQASAVAVLSSTVAGTEPLAQPDSPPARPDATELSDLINGVLVGQARRHGVDLS